MNPLRNTTDSKDREIKFRAWHKNGHWFQSFYISGVNSVHDFRTLAFTDITDDVILMQYTGLKDKNGIEIYEGDILTDGDGEWAENDTVFLYYIAGIVTWWSDNGRWHLSDDLKGYMGDDDNADEPMEWTKYEVVGNIYENKELLK